jgi:hypothetical protein
VLSDILYKQKYQGSDHETVEIDEARAERLMRTWVEIGRIPKPPSDESSIPPGPRTSRLLRLANLDPDHRILHPNF